MSKLFRVGSNRFVLGSNLSGSGLWTIPGSGGGGGGGSTLLWPKTSDTGIPAGTTLTNYTGPAQITTSGTVIDSKRINYELEIRTSNVILRKCLIKVNDYYGILSEIGTNLTIEDCEFDATGSSRMCNLAINGGAVRRCNIHGSVIAVKIWGPTVFEDNYIHDLQETSSNIDDRHFDGVAMLDGQANGTIIRHCAIHMPTPQGGTASVFISGQYGKPENITIQNTLMLGTPSYPAYAEASTYGCNNINYTNNHMKKGDWGYILNTGTNTTDSGNVKFDGAVPTEVTTWLNAT